MKLDVYPAFGKKPIAAVTPQDVLAMLRKIEERRAFETASRVIGFCSLIFKYAVTLGLVDADPCRDLRPALKPYAKGQLAAITKPKEVGALMLSIDDYKGSLVVRSALLYSALTFCRPGEIRHAEWTEIDFDENMWTIPAEKMKGRVEHKVPLSRQALDVLEGIRPYTGSGKYVFPTPRSPIRPLSENGVLTALRNPEVPALLETIKQRGLKWGIVSNLATPYAEPLLKLLPFAPDTCAWSFAVGYRKPEEGIYRHACNALGVEPSPSPSQV